MTDFYRGEVVQFGLSHKWAGCLGVIREIKGERYRVGVLLPTQDGDDTPYITYIYVTEKDIIKLAIMDTIEKHQLYHWPSFMCPVSVLVPFNPEQEEESEEE